MMRAKAIQLVCGLIAMACLWADHQAPAAEPAPAVGGDPAIALFAVGKTNPPPATLILRNRKIAEFRTTLFGVTPSNRVESIKERFFDSMARGGAGEVAFRKEPQGILITLDGEGLMGVTPDDVDPSAGSSLDQSVTNIVSGLRTVIGEEQAERSLRGVITSIVLGVLATGFYCLGLWAIRCGNRWLSRRLGAWTTQSAERLAQGAVSPFSRRLAEATAYTIEAIAWAARLLIALLWVTYVLEQFPFTRPWGDFLVGYLRQAGHSLLRQAGAAAPGLLIVTAIFFFTRFTAQLLRLLFIAVAQKRIRLRWVDADTALMTQRILVVLLWLLALVMAYPYLPGSNTEAFKAIGVFAGLLLSLGSSSVVSQIASGLLLVYSRALKPGEYVRVADTEGTVVSVGLVSTRIRSNKDEEIHVPNAVLIGNKTINYSRRNNTRGVLLHTTITIGYSTPWRQVHAMLEQAANDVSGLLRDPPPFVLQTALSDFYVEYQLNATLEEPQKRMRVLAALHARIQDVFNEYGVQIMSPHYEADPPQPVVVPKSDWFASPAAKGTPATTGTN